MPTLADLLTPRTRTQWRTLLLTELSGAGFAVSLAPTNDHRRNLVELVAAGLAKVDETVAKIANGAYLSLATGDWLSLRATAGFDVTPKVATQTRGTVRLTCAVTAGPYTIAAGDVWVGRAASGATPARRYQNTSGGALASGGTLDVTVVAESPGTAYNLGVGQLTALFSGLSGVAVSNPGSGSPAAWITTAGTDDEAADPLRARCRDRWATLGRGATEAAYAYLATTASDEVTRVKVVAVPGDGTLRVYLAGASGGASAGAVTTVQGALATLAPLTDRPTAVAATNTTITLTGTVTVRTAQLAAVQAAVETERLAMQASLGIGDPVDLAELNAILRRPRGTDGLVVPGVTDVDLTAPTGDTTVAATAVAVLDFTALVWVSV